MSILKRLSIIIAILSIYAVYPTCLVFGHPQTEIEWDESLGEGIELYALTPMTDPLVRVDTMSCKVGEIPFVSSVSPTGGKTYEVPIDVYPGVMGMQPDLALSYDSQMGQSLVGIGWTLKGLSAITRTPRTPVYDGMANGIKMNASDGYILDGCRLLFAPSSNGDIVYETEQGNVMVKAHMDGDVTLYFEAFYPDGRKGVFGFTDNTQNRTSYPLSRLEDIHGNAITYTYTYAGNSYRPLSIRYNGCFVDFSYEARGTPITMYVGGVKMTTDVRLKTIKTRIVNNEYGTYTLDYTENDKISLLSSIGYSVGVSARLNPLRFFYGESDKSGEFTISNHYLNEWPETGDNPDKFHTVTGRFGNGLSNESLLVYEPAVSYWQVTTDKFVNKYNSKNQILIYPSNTTGLSTTPLKMNIGSGFVDIFPINETGSRDGSLVCVRNYVSGSSDRISLSVYTVTETTGIKARYTRYFDFTTLLTDKSGVKSVQPKLFYPGDFDGDGRTEILAMAIPVLNLPAMCYVISPEDNKLLYQGTLVDFLYTFPGDSYPSPIGAQDASDKFLAIDYDGDGKTDLCHVSYKGATCYTFETQGSGARWSKLPTDPTLTQTFLRHRTYLPGDYNGDGLVDLLISPEVDEAQDKTWTLMTAKGNGYWEKSTFTGPLNKSDINNGFCAVDIDGDGVHDLMCHTEKDVSVYRNACGVFSSTPIKESYESNLQIPVILRIKPDGGGVSTFATVRDGVMKRYSFPTIQNEDVLLSAMSSSLGIVEKNSYVSLDDEGHEDIYSSDANVTYPYTAFREQLAVVSRSETWMNRSMTAALSYRYQNGVFHTQGLGFCGFEKITIENERGQKTEQVYEPCRRGVLKSLKNPFREVTYINTVQQKYSGYKVLSITLSESLEKDLLKNIKIYRDYKYDIDGNVLTMNSQFDDGTKITTVNTYESNRELEDGHYLGYLVTQNIETKKDGKSVKEGRKVLSYDKFQPLRRYFTYNGNITKEEKFEYDAKGNPTKQSERYYTSAVWHTTLLSYDGMGRLVKQTDPFGLETSMSFSVAGVKTSSTDELGNTTIYSYDPFRREIERITPDGVKTETSYSWQTYSSGGMYSVRVKSDTDPVSIKVYDGKNREIRSLSECYNGQYLVSQKVYDNWDNITRESSPTTVLLNSVWTYHTYDQYNRILGSRDNSGKTTTYSYSGNTVTIKDREVEKKFVYDGMGRLSSVQDVAGTVSYSYDPKGNPVKITSPGNAETTYTYDKYGRRSSMEDPSRGLTSWEYDAEGNVSKETDARGIEKTYAYDSHNRLKTAIVPEFTTTYTYDDYNRISDVSSSNNTTTSYSYDTLGRLSECKEATGVASLIKRYAYTGGLLSSLTYVTGQRTTLKESYVYQRGHHTKTVVNDTLSIYELKAQNIYGLRSRIATGPLTRTYSYSQYCIPTGRSAAVGTETIQNEKYVFDPLTLNLTSRSNLLRDINEAFSYDPLNRLVAYGDNTVSYSANGNILSKSDVGDFSYNNISKPYAVTGIDTATGSVNTTSQQAVYASFERPAEISQGEWKYTFAYNGSYDKVSNQLYRNSTLVDQRNYLGGIYEFHQYQPTFTPIQPLVADGSENSVIKPFLTKEELFYLGGDYYSSGAVGVVSGGKLRVYYLLRDYLGSIVAITDNNGKLVQELSYDAWGNQRSPETHEVFSGENYNAPRFGRGYTGHSHLVRVGLIDMNARLYDPVVSRFLSPDPFVQAPEDSQNFNRYTYCLNNPLCYVDESGEIWWWAIGAAIGGTINLLDKCLSGQVNNFWDGVTAFGIGAVSGALAGYVGGLGAGLLGTMSTGAIGGAVGGALGSAVGMIAESALNTYSFGDPRLSIKELAMGTLMGAVVGGVSNGIVAEMQGRNFYTGKVVAVELQTTISPIKVSELPDVNPKFNIEGPNINVEAPQIKINSPTFEALDAASQQKYRKLVEEFILHGKLNDMDITQELNVTLTKGKYKLDVRVETHDGLDQVFKNYGVTNEMEIRHLNLELYEVKPQTLSYPQDYWKYRVIRIPGQTTKNYHKLLPHPKK